MKLPINLSLPYPISVNNYYRTYRNIQTISKEGKLFKSKVSGDYKDLQPISDSVRLKILIHPKQNKDGSASKMLIDLDNGLKCILDSLQGIVYNDDKQVKSLTIDYGACKLGGGVTVIVDYFNQHECVLISKQLNCS